MGSVGAKAIKRTEKEKEEEYIDWDARKNQTQKVGRLSLIVRAMRTANRTAALTDGGATSATNETGAEGSSLSNKLADLSERDNAILTREQELSSLTALGDAEFHVDSKLKYDAQLESELTDPCVICAMYKHKTILECRVCGRPYHHSCLTGRGIGLDTNSAKALESADTEIGWTCPDCDSFVDLITMDAMSGLMVAFDNYDTDGGQIQSSKFNQVIINCDKQFTKNFIKSRFHNNAKLGGSLLRKSMPFADSAHFTFEIYDRNGDGMVSWWDFLMVETVKLLQHQPQSQIVKYLKSEEISRLRRFFKMSDKHNIGLVTVGESEQAYRGWLRAQGLQNTDEMMRSFERSSSSDECNKMITWERFIWNKALAVITSRPNTQTIKPYVVTNEQTAL
ncbi:PHD finger protein 24-like [Asterias rubens]|uniref:PHD finger protein 24-like n=1 Tax=Asterias rubens TaxID=7604 RepID=UPI00145546A9|nr:PHD finger protein 24-like [Asterias rubens]